MSKKDRQAKTSEQTKNEQIAIILAELENDIEHFKVTVKKRRSATTATTAASTTSVL